MNSSRTFASDEDTDLSKLVSPSLAALKVTSTFRGLESFPVKNARGLFNDFLRSELADFSGDVDMEVRRVSLGGL